jgi:hypothetical protein
MLGEISLDKLLERAVNGLDEIQSKTRDEMRSWLRSLPFIPPMISMPGGGVRFITKDGLGALHEFGRRWRREDQNRRRLIGEEAAAQLAVSAFGEMLRPDTLKGLPPDWGIADFKRRFRVILSDRLSTFGREVEYSFPCQIFEEQNLPSFDVGPVCFLPRDKWLGRVEQRARASLHWTSVVASYWDGKGEPPPSGKEPGSVVVEAFGSCGWVATVAISGRERNRSRETATTAARIAIDTLGLPLNAMTARKLRAPGDELQVHHANALYQLNRQDLSVGWSIDWPSLSAGAGDAGKFVTKYAGLRRAAGKALGTLIEDVPTASTPGMHERWLEAMYWFGEARREAVGFIALVKLGICLDVLAKGGKSAGITKLCCALFDKQPDAAITYKGRSLKWLIETIYNEGRSQIGHGARLALMGDLPIDRGAADLLARYALIEYILRLDRYSGKDDYREFLKAIPNLKGE